MRMDNWNVLSRIFEQAQPFSFRLSISGAPTAIALTKTNSLEIIRQIANGSAIKKQAGLRSLRLNRLVDSSTIV